MELFAGAAEQPRAPKAQRGHTWRGGPAVVRSGLMSMLALVALGGTRLIHGSIISRATDQQTYAVVGTLIGVAMTVGLFLPGGLASAASKFIPYRLAGGDPQAALAVRSLLVRVGYGSAVVLGVATGWGMAALLDLSAGEAVATGLLTAAFSVYSIEKGALYGFDRVASYLRLQAVGSAIAIASTVIVVALGWRMYLLPLILGYTVLIVGAWWTLRARQSSAVAHVSTSDRREIAGYVALASIGGMASAGFLQLLPLLATRFTTPVEVSHFVAAVTLIAPLYFLPRALGMALFPALAHSHGAGDLTAVRRQTDISTRGLLVVLAPLFAVALLIAREVLVVFGGTRYGDGAAVLQVLLVATYLSVIQVAAVNALSSDAGRGVRIPVFFGVAGGLVGLAAVIPLGLWFAAAGVGVAYLLGTAVSAVGPIAAVWRRYQMAWAGPALRSLLVVGGAWGVAIGVDAMGAAGGGRLLVDLGVALLVGLVAVFLLRRDIREVMSGSRRRSSMTSDLSHMP